MMKVSMNTVFDFRAKPAGQTALHLCPTLMLSRMEIPPSQGPQLLRGQPGPCALTPPGSHPHPGLTMQWTAHQLHNHVSQIAYGPESEKNVFTGCCSAEQSEIGAVMGV